MSEQVTLGMDYEFRFHRTMTNEYFSLFSAVASMRDACCAVSVYTAPVRLDVISGDRQSRVSGINSSINGERRILRRAPIDRRETICIDDVRLFIMAC